MKRGGDLFWLLLGALALLALWQGAAGALGSPILLPGPLLTARRFFVILRTRRFLVSLGETFWRVILGILIAVPPGIAAGLAGALNRPLGLFLKPLFTVIASTPVMAVILIAFLILGQERTPVFTAFLMVFPVMSATTAEGVRALDPRYRELMRIYRVSRTDALRFLYIPGVAPFILGGLRSGLSLCWKVVVAAEVLVQPLRALGSGMQLAKAHLETPELYAWTAATVLAAALSQGLLSLVLKCFGGRGFSGEPGLFYKTGAAFPKLQFWKSRSSDTTPDAPGSAADGSARDRIGTENLSFSFSGKDGEAIPVFRNLSLGLGGENPAVILGPSGCGKTTLLRLLAGLLVPESAGSSGESAAGEGTGGVLSLPGAFVFQDSRLLPWLTVLENVLLPLRGKMDGEKARERALHFLELVSLTEKASARPALLSGGEKQRVSIARAFAYPAPVLYMDEPFQSLDIPLRLELMDLTRSLMARDPRLLVMVTHDPREAVYLGRRVLVLGRNAGGIVFDGSVDLPPAKRSFEAAEGGALAARLLAALAKG
ncbi:MAG: ATP-binding cassette domain-containing protein [Spirochaetaceae bacterium]|nr:ATP-binding cassette domain-containing protein [Spirochaetaceae bacterium]